MIVITRPIGTGNIQGTNTTGLVIPPTVNLNIDDVPHASNVAVKWIYVIKDTVLNKVRTAEVLATHRSGTLPLFNVSGSMGDIIPHTVDVSIVGANLRLSIQNNSANPLNTSIVRIQVAA